MMLALRTGATTWHLNGTWAVVPTKPSRRMLRRRARGLEMTHFVLIPGERWTIGFFSLPPKTRQRAIRPGALALAKRIGPDKLIEVQITEDQFWIVGTNARGELERFSDSVLSASERDALETTIPREILAGRQQVGYGEAEDLLRGLEGGTVPLVPVSLEQPIRIAVGSLAAVGAVWCAFVVWQHHRAIVDQEARQARLLLARRQNANAQHMVLPNDWLAACHEAVGADLLRNGWALASWTCKPQVLIKTWTRDGGTLETAPDGKLEPSSQGNTVTETVPLRLTFSAADHASHKGGMRRLIAKLQNANVALQVGSVSPTDFKTAVHFAWPTEPSTTDWNSIPGLEFAEMSAATGIDAQNWKTAPGTYTLTARVSGGPDQ
ncbi:MAG: hypothetical protein ABF479_01205 [Gluconacetobacter sp.]|mgnify:CR=1 FL=1